LHRNSIPDDGSVNTYAEMELLRKRSSVDCRGAAAEMVAALLEGGAANQDRER
jgi:hypothetical protein